MKHGTINRQPRGVTRARVLAAISAYLASHGYAPTLRELQELTGRLGISTIHCHLHTLRSAGVIAFEDGKPRTIRIIEQARHV